MEEKHCFAGLWYCVLTENTDNAIMLGSLSLGNLWIKTFLESKFPFVAISLLSGNVAIPDIKNKF